ncbi:hypothetical protein Dimus_014414 [Dionaea muscipula]
MGLGNTVEARVWVVWKPLRLGPGMVSPVRCGDGCPCRRQSGVPRVCSGCHRGWFVDSSGASDSRKGTTGLAGGEVGFPGCAPVVAEGGLSTVLAPPTRARAQRTVFVDCQAALRPRFEIMARMGWSDLEPNRRAIAKVERSLATGVSPSSFSVESDASAFD